MKSKIGNFEIDTSPAIMPMGNLNDDILRGIYREVGVEICSTGAYPDPELRAEYFNFLCNASGLKVTRIAERLYVKRTQVSRWRIDVDEIGDVDWGLITVFFSRELGT